MWNILKRNEESTLYTDNENQIDYADQMKSDLLAVQDIKIKLFKSRSLHNVVINGIVPHLMNQFEGKFEFIPSNNESLDIEIMLKPSCKLTDPEINYMVDKLVYDLLLEIKTYNYLVLTSEEWSYIMGNKYNLLYMINIFPNLVIIRF